CLARLRNALCIGLYRQHTPIDNGEHAMANLAILEGADFLGEVRVAGSIDLEEADREIDGEDVAPRRHAVIDLLEQFEGEIRMLHGTGSELGLVAGIQLEQTSGAAGRRGPEERVLDVLVRRAHEWLVTGGRLAIARRS